MLGLNSYVAALVSAVAESSGSTWRVSLVSAVGRAWGVSLVAAISGTAGRVSLAAAEAAAVAAGREAGLGTAAESAGTTPAVAVAAVAAIAAAAGGQVTVAGDGGFGAHCRQKGQSDENLTSKVKFGWDMWLRGQRINKN